MYVCHRIICSGGQDHKSVLISVPGQDVNGKNRKKTYKTTNICSFSFYYTTLPNKRKVPKTPYFRAFLTLSFLSRGRGDRTPVNGFGDRPVRYQFSPYFRAFLRSSWLLDKFRDKIIPLKLSPHFYTYIINHIDTFFNQITHTGAEKRIITSFYNLFPTFAISFLLTT